MAQARSFLTVEPASVLATAFFVHDRRVYLRLWNPSSQEAIASVHVGEGSRVAAVDLDLQSNYRLLSGEEVSLRPWGIQTLIIQIP